MERRKYRALKYNADGEHSNGEWMQLLTCYYFVCVCCFKDSEPLARDHIVPLSKGGSDWIDNIQPLCKSCNSSKGVKTISYLKDFALRWSA